MLWPHHGKSQRTAEGETVGWHHRLNGHEFEKAPGEVKNRDPGVLQSMGSKKSQT